jgi:hypothetical protein
MLNVAFSRLGATTANAEVRTREIERQRTLSDRLAALERLRKSVARRRVLWR